MISFRVTYTYPDNTYGSSGPWGINFRISYSISYGRKVEQDNGPGSTGELGSGILR